MPVREKPKKIESDGAAIGLLFPSYRAVWHVNADRPVQGERERPIDEAKAKELLGWEEEVEGGPKFGTEYLLTDRYNRKIRCKKNVRNRPLYPSNIESIVQELLNKRWRINGEPIIIGQSGIDLNGQHQLISVVLANQDLRREQEKWGKLHSEPVSMEKLVVFGIEELDIVVNTMDTCKPRSLADVIYRSPYFANYKESDRRSAAKVADYAIKQLWCRTGIYNNPFSSLRTHSEAIDFIERHKRLLKCIRHILEENRGTTDSETGEEVGGKLGDFVPAGYATSVLYVMGCSSSAPDSYYARELPDEKKLDWKNWDKACEFWSLFGKDQKFKAVRSTLASLVDEAAGIPWSLKTCDYVICKAWKSFLAGKAMTAESLKVRWTPPDERGRVCLLDVPDLAGIDLGLEKISRDPDNPEGGELREIEARKEETMNGHGKVKVSAGSDDANIEKMRKDYSGSIVFMKSALGKWVAWGSDATVAGEILGEAPKMNPKGIRALTYTEEQLQSEIVGKLTVAEDVVLCQTDERGEWYGTKYEKKKRKK